MRLAAALLAAILLPGCSPQARARWLEPIFGCHPMPMDEQQARARQPLAWIPERDEPRPLGLDDFRGRR